MAKTPPSPAHRVNKPLNRAHLPGIPRDGDVKSKVDENGLLA